MSKQQPVKSKKRAPSRRGGGTYSLDEFHGVLQSLCPPDADGNPTVLFTKGAVMGLQRAYETYLTTVASILAQHDSLDDEQVVAECLGITPEISEMVTQAQKRLATTKSDPATNSDSKIPAVQQSRGTKKRLKRQKITADMEAEQERLLQQSKASILGKLKDEQKKHTEKE